MIFYHTAVVMALHAFCGIKVDSSSFGQKMSPEITVKKDYILIEPKEGADFWEIQRGIARLFYVTEIPKKNRIWLFREGTQKLTEADLYKIRDLLKENYPQDSTISKTAIVVETGLQPNMAEAFARIIADMPHEFRVFSKLAEAESWVKK